MGFFSSQGLPPSPRTKTALHSTLYRALPVLVCTVHSPILKGPQSHHGVGGKHGSDPTHLWPGPWLGFCLHVCTPRLHCLGGEWCVTPSHCSPDSALPGRLLSAQPNSWPKAGLPQFSSWEESPSCNQPTPSPSHLWEQLENGSSPCATHTQAQAPD